VSGEDTGEGKGRRAKGRERKRRDGVGRKEGEEPALLIKIVPVALIRSCVT